MTKRVMKRRAKKAGLPPGSLVYLGDKPNAATKIQLFDYLDGHLTEREVVHPDECAPFKDSDTVTWINIDGIQNVGVLEKIGKQYDLHPLVLEDILNTDQRPKVEDHERYLYVVLKMLSYNEAEQEIAIEQLSLILGDNFVLSFQDKPGDVLEPLRERIRQSKGKIRKLGADYLLYAIMDEVVDHYFVVMEKLGEKIEQIEDIVAVRPKQDTLQQIHRLKREIIVLRKAVWPLRELISTLRHDDTPLLSESTEIYFRDLNDHIVQIIDGVEAYRDMLSSMLDVYLSIMSNRTNGVMKVLALFSAIFMPLTFITGIFGMNFKDFPELEWKYGFQGTVILMVVMAVGMIIFFRRRRWL
jgi:magnesium transporter